MTYRVWFPLVLLLSVACTPPKTSVTLLSNKVFPSKPQNCEIQILTEPPTSRKFEEIAILNTVAYGQLKPPLASLYMDANDKDLKAMLPSLKATACNLGADAVLIKSVEPGLQTSQESYGKVFALAIKFID